MGPSLVKMAVQKKGARPSGSTDFSCALKRAYNGLMHYRLSLTNHCYLCRSPWKDPMRFQGCNHTFCHGCITEHLHNRPFCPVCGDMRRIRYEEGGGSRSLDELEVVEGDGQGMRRCRERPIFILLSDGQDQYEQVREMKRRDVDKNTDGGWWCSL